MISIVPKSDLADLCLDARPNLAALPPQRLSKVVRTVLRQLVGYVDQRQSASQPTISRKPCEWVGKVSVSDSGRACLDSHSRRLTVDCILCTSMPPVHGSTTCI